MEMSSNVKIRIVEWKDRAFVAAIEVACRALTLSGVRLDTIDAAQRVQTQLREDGFPDAVVEYHRSVDEALHGIAHWRVQRDGRPLGA
jgi:hypothetical protein